MQRAVYSVLLFGLLTPLLGWAEKRLSPAEAKEHVGEHATVCGLVASSRYAQGTRGQPTFLNFDNPYQNAVFTVVIWGENRGKFGEPEEKYVNKQVCVSGDIRQYRGSPEIVATEPSQIQEQ
jgi:micrococcal nuclease